MKKFIIYATCATVWFPASGWRSFLNGSLSDVGSDGYYWSAVPNSVYDVCGLDFNSVVLNPQSNSSRQAYGISVRPVADN